MASEEYLQINERLDKIERLVLMGAKDILTIEDVSLMTGFTVGNLYRMTSNKTIPFYKPLGGKIFFDKTEIENWLRTNKVETRAVTESKANTYCFTHK
jgi:excisionase family DNA binding protein